MKMFKTLALGAAVSVGLLATSGAIAATNDGDLGSTSTGTFDINLTVGNLYRVFGLTPFTFTAPNLAAQTKPICIYSNAAKFNLDIDTTNTFELQNTAGTPGGTYVIDINEGNNGAGDLVKQWTASNHTALDVDTLALDATNDEVLGTCSVGNFSVKVTPTLETNIAADSYTDQVTLIVKAI
ncbi:hypothetical protein [Endozoicomonas ascidiicola]|uniref:hypothetical protein n=1 Tax=Endozoicomonas ascidiicola TaxID=1698521 RepID=UPI000AA88A3F|nr:hypothetical protein [Endozoicomonas ascidiicola]